MLDRLDTVFATAGDRLRIVAMHHPLEHLPGEEQWLMQGAGLALRRLPEMGVRVVLSGHVHVSHAGPFAAAPGLLFVQAGTGLSFRRRAEANAFNLLDIRDTTIEVRTILADDTGAFADVGREHSFPHVA
jgi:3',5'-cyclic AMP phosphodiesterase CpdA